MVEILNDQVVDDECDNLYVFQDDDLFELDSWVGEILFGILVVGFIIIVVFVVMVGEWVLMLLVWMMNQVMFEIVLVNIYQCYEDWVV